MPSPDISPTRNALNIVFAGTPDFAAHHLQALLDSRHNVVAVYTQPDRPAGRGKKLTSSPVKSLALDHTIPVEQPLTLKDADAQAVLSNYCADVMVVVAYGLLLPEAVLHTPRFGCLNVHGSILPRWRGAAPIQRAIEAGDTETGVTIMQMDKGLDTGDMLYISTCPIDNGETSATLHDKLMDLGAPALLHVLDQLQEATLKPEVQDDTQACYAEKISKQEAAIDWREPAAVIARKICAFNPFPVAYSFLEGDRIKIYQADSVSSAPPANAPVGTIIEHDDHGLYIQCGEGRLCVKILQMPNKKAMPIADVLNGHAERFAPGNVLTAQ